jgi:hypothetical protein
MQLSGNSSAPESCVLFGVWVQINAVGPLKVVKSLLPLLEAGSSKVTRFDR